MNITPATSPHPDGVACETMAVVESAAMTDDTTTDAPALDSIAERILELLAAAGPESSISPTQVAQAVAEGRRKRNDPPDAWRRYLPAVKQQALHLARTGKLVVLRKGKPVDAQSAKGVIRYQQPV